MTKRSSNGEAIGQQELSKRPAALSKAPTGIQGLDEITGGGLPAGRPTLICGSAGCGKTMLAVEFLVRGATQFGEPGVFMTFEENAAELTANVRSLGFDLDELAAAEKDRARLRPHRAQRDRGNRRIRSRRAVHPPWPCHRFHRRQASGARHARGACSPGCPNHAILRAELRRLFRWLKDRGMTAVITGEKGDGDASRGTAWRNTWPTA